MKNISLKNVIFFATTVIFSFLLIIIINIVAAINNYGMEGDEVFTYISSTSMGGFKGICYLDDQTWYKDDYFSNALITTGAERFNYKMVVENQAMDTHPPFYYILLNIITSFFPGQFSKWFGIGLNIALMLLVWTALFLLFQHFLHERYLSAIFCTIFCCSRFSVNMVLFIRMYVLLMALCLFQSWYHLILYEKMLKQNIFSLKKYWKNYLILIFITILGAWSHYYFIIYQCLISFLFVLALIKQKKVHNTLSYIGSMFVGALLYIFLYPAAINHIFLKYRGRDAVHKFLKGSSLLNEIFSMFKQYDKQVFKGFLIPIILFIGIGTILLLKNKKMKLVSIIQNSILLLPAFIYFIGISKASPFVTIRYISPVAAIFYATVIIWGIKLIRHMNLNQCLKKRLYIIICLIFAIVTVYFGTIPIKDSYFSEKKEIINELADKSDYCVYISGDEYNWKMWEDYIYYPLFKGLYFIDGNILAPISDEKLSKQNTATIFIDTVLNKDDIISYLSQYLQFSSYDVMYTTPYTYIIWAH